MEKSCIFAAWFKTNENDNENENRLKMKAEEAIDILYKMDGMVWRSGERGMEAVEMAADALRKVHGEWWLARVDKISDKAASYADLYDDGRELTRDDLEEAFCAGADYVKRELIKGE